MVAQHFLFWPGWFVKCGISFLFLSRLLSRAHLPMSRSRRPTRSYNNANNASRRHRTHAVLWRLTTEHVVEERRRDFEAELCQMSNVLENSRRRLEEARATYEVLRARLEFLRSAARQPECEQAGPTLPSEEEGSAEGK